MSTEGKHWKRTKATQVLCKWGKKRLPPWSENDPVV